MAGERSAKYRQEIQQVRNIPLPPEFEQSWPLWLRSTGLVTAERPKEGHQKAHSAHLPDDTKSLLNIAGHIPAALGWR